MIQLVLFSDIIFDTVFTNNEGFVQMLLRTAPLICCLLCKDMMHVSFVLALKH